MGIKLMTTIILILTIFALCSSDNYQTDKFQTDKKETEKLVINYKWKYGLPFLFKLTESNNFLLSNGKEIVFLSKQGVVVKEWEYMAPDSIPFHDVVYSDIKDKFYMLFSEFILSSDGEKHLIEGCFDLNNWSEEVFFCRYQKYIVDENRVEEGIYKIIFGKENIKFQITDYPYTMLNLIVNSNNLYFIDLAARFNVFSLTTEENHFKSATLLKELVNDRRVIDNEEVFFLGIIDNSFLFRIPDRLNSIEHIYIYQTNDLSFSKKIELDSKEELDSTFFNEHSVEIPLGNIFAFGRNEIFFYSNNIDNGIIHTVKISE